MCSSAADFAHSKRGWFGAHSAAKDWPRAFAIICAWLNCLRNGLQRLIDDKNLLEQLRDGCDAVARSLSWDEPVATMERIYESLLEPKTIPGKLSVPVGAPASKRI